MDVEPVLRDIVEKSMPSVNDGDWTDEEGFLCCGVCNQRKEIEVDLPWGKTVVGVMCKCDMDRERRRDERRQSRERMARVESLRSQGIQDRSLWDAKFEKSVMDNGLNVAKKYADNWPEMKENGIGLLLVGGTGRGKTHAAACIVNSLLEKGIPCLITSFPRILGAGFEREQIIRDMRNYDLVVIDDLGAERDTEYSAETIYLVIDERYKSGKPMIITTNLTPDEMTQPSSITYKRIYDRILEVCKPVAFGGKDYREERRQSNLAIAKDILQGGNI